MHDRIVLSVYGDRPHTVIRHMTFYYLEYSLSRWRYCCDEARQTKEKQILKDVRKKVQKYIHTKKTAAK